jgi:CTP synthase (UTP-ammonia lyase)
VIVEYVRNVLGVEGADHAESNPDADTLAITPLSCAVGWGIDGEVDVADGSLASELYGRAGRFTESYYCTYGVNPEFRPRLEAAGLRVTGADPDGEPRIVELDRAAHPFFLATLFIPQMRSAPDAPHPLIRGYAAAARARAAATRAA